MNNNSLRKDLSAITSNKSNIEFEKSNMGGLSITVFDKKETKNSFYIYNTTENKRDEDFDKLESLLK